MSGEFAGKVVVITGAGSGIGRASALAFARLGATVVAANRRTADGEALVAEIAAQGGRANFVATDVTQPSQVRSLMDDAFARHGRLDVVFNNAGYQEPRSTITDTPEATFDQVFDTNTRATWLGMRYALAHMRAQGRGVIINCASASGLRNANVGCRCIPRRRRPSCR
jgi:NAD(P)-dependent dehydrogenase (short-subunit alcohol dehydrogenase family)